MNIEIERKGFEAVYPVPEGVKWSPEINEYFAVLHSGMEAIEAANAQNKYWSGWLARAEVEAGEVVAWRYKALIVGEYDHERNMWSPSWHYSTSKPATTLAGMEVAKDIEPLFTTPQPSDFNAGIEAAVHALEEEASQRWAEYLSEHETGSPSAAQSFCWWQGIKQGLGAILALRKGVV